jgi:ADP-L-glycero-D-manno-heptose 6-epimerase
VKVLVTGASGFVGRNLVERLLEEGHEITATSMSGENKLPKGVKKILHYGLEGIDWSGVEGMDVVIHLAANTNTLCNDKQEMFRANLYDPITLFTMAKIAGCRRFIYASSTAVYGNSPAPYIEDETPINPLNVYADSKRQFDDVAMRFAENDITVIGLRYCNIYGPGEAHKGHSASVIGKMYHRMRLGHKFTLFRDGEQKRDWVYVKDVVEANMLALKYEGQSGIFNIGTGTAVSFNAAAALIQEILGDETNQLAPDYKDCPFPEKYQSHTCCSIEKARTHLGFSPRYDLRSGLNDYQQFTIRHEISWRSSQDCSRSQSFH